MTRSNAADGSVRFIGNAVTPSVYLSLGSRAGGEPSGTIEVFERSFVLVCAGCGSGEPPLHDVSGSVTFNAQPLPDGEVVFISENGRASEPGGA